MLRSAVDLGSKDKPALFLRFVLTSSFSLTFLICGMVHPAESSPTIQRLA